MQCKRPVPTHAPGLATAQSSQGRSHWHVFSEELPVIMRSASPDRGVVPCVWTAAIIDQGSGLLLTWEIHKQPPTAETYSRMVLTTYARSATREVPPHSRR